MNPAHDPTASPRPSTPLWFITFADMVTLLLGFFVLLLAFSHTEAAKFKSAAESLQSAFGGVAVSDSAQSGAGALGMDTGADYPTRRAIMQKLNGLRKELKLDQNVRAQLDPEGVRVRIDGAFAFQPASASLEAAVLPFIDQLTMLVEANHAKLIVEGHTDATPVKSALYPSNWELSASRAAAVVRYLESRGIPSAQLEAVGCADSRPLADNFTDGGRRRNRRVELLLKLND